MPQGRSWSGGYKKSKPSTSNYSPNRRKYNSNNQSNDNYNNNNITALTSSKQERNKIIKEKERHLDKKFGYRNLETGETKRGWVFQILATTANDSNSNSERSGVDIFFIDENNGSDGGGSGVFKFAMFHRPHFYLLSNPREEEEFDMLKKP